MALEPNRRSNILFSPPTQLCSVMYITEISLNVTLSNHSTHPNLYIEVNSRGVVCINIQHYKTGNRRYKFLVLGREGPHFVKEHSDSKNKYTEDDIVYMLEFLVDNIFVVFGEKVFQQIVGIPMGTNCAPLLADIFLYSYEAEFIQSMLSTGKKKLASQFNFTYRYIDDVLSINNPDFENYLGQMYPAEFEIKDTTESNTSASCLDLLLSIESDGQLQTSLYDKRDDFNFHITNFPFLSSNIPSSPAYGVFISQLIRYARVCSSYECFILRAARLSSKLLRQGYVMERLKSSLRKFYGRYGDLIKQPSPKCYLTFWDMTIYNDTLNWSDITPICELITELDFNTDFDLITEIWKFP